MGRTAIFLRAALLYSLWIIPNEKQLPEGK
jgi:hypothetical protein